MSSFVRLSEMSYFLSTWGKLLLKVSYIVLTDCYFFFIAISQDRAASELSASDDQGKQVKESNRLKLFDNLFRDVTGSIEEELRDLKSMQEHCADDITKAGEC